jgi:hypothetical protein
VCQGFPVVDAGKVVGIVTGRDLRFESRYELAVSEIMTPRERLVTVPEGTTPEQAKALLNKHKLERLLLVNDAFELKGLITVKDITKQLNFPNAARDAAGRLRVGAAVGVGEGTEERVEALVKAGVDAIVVDTGPRPQQGRDRSCALGQAELPRRGRDRRQHCHRQCRACTGGSRCRWREGRYRPRLHLHHPHRGGRGRSADHPPSTTWPPRCRPPACP